MTRNEWGLPVASSDDELDEHGLLKKAVVEAIQKLELAQLNNTSRPHARLLEWEALHILRKAMRGEK